MLKIKATLVAKLRNKTGAPVMECKKALIENNGNISKAKKFLKIKLNKKNFKISNNSKKSGIISISINNKFGIILNIQCKTDFVAKNKEFIKFTKKITNLIKLKKPKNLNEINKILLKKENLKKYIIKKSNIFGENITLKEYKYIKSNYKLISYNHDNKIGVIVEFTGDKNTAKDIAMHIAAMKPLVIHKKNIPEKKIKKEIYYIKSKIKNLNKKEEIKNIIINNSIKNYKKEISLLEQNFIKNEKINVKNLLKKKKTNIKSFILSSIND